MDIRRRHVPLPRKISHLPLTCCLVVASLGIFFSLLFLLPFSRSLVHWPVDLCLFILFMIAFGLFASILGNASLSKSAMRLVSRAKNGQDFKWLDDCGGVWNWNDLRGHDECSKFKANTAFCFLASVFFLASAILVGCSLFFKPLSMWSYELMRNRESSWYAAVVAIWLSLLLATRNGTRAPYTLKSPQHGQYEEEVLRSATRGH